MLKMSIVWEGAFLFDKNLCHISAYNVAFGVAIVAIN